jgi:hypothetical protein
MFFGGGLGYSVPVNIVEIIDINLIPPIIPPTTPFSVPTNESSNTTSTQNENENF